MRYRVRIRVEGVVVVEAASELDATLAAAQLRPLAAGGFRIRDVQVRAEFAGPAENHVIRPNDVIQQPQLR